MGHLDSFSSRGTLIVAGQRHDIVRLDALDKARVGHPGRLPYSLRILLENLLRREDGSSVTADDVAALAGWDPASRASREIAFMPARVLLQDFTGVPAVADLAAMRDALARLGGDPARINPVQPADLVIDHSVQVDAFGTPDALRINAGKEFLRNQERYVFLRWGQQAFRNFRVVPPDTGIVHQVNLERLAQVVFRGEPQGGSRPAYPDTLVGTDSHTTMINALGVLGWGVGGIEAEAAMLGQPISMLVPEVVGFRLTGAMPAGSTATDLVLTATQALRARGVVGAFVEFFGDGVAALSLPDRATLANMAPEYGATMGFFPVDDETLRYLRLTGRPPELVALVESYCKEQGLFRTAGAPDPVYHDILTLDLSTIRPSLAGPRRPQDRIPLDEAKRSFRASLAGALKESAAPADLERLEAWAAGDGAGADPRPAATVSLDGDTRTLRAGSVVIAAITSCTNTSNPAVMLGAGLLARKAVRRGLRTKPWVKTSLAPGSQVVADYLRAAGVMQDLETLGFHLVGFGCTTCIGNSGPLPEPVAEAVQSNGLWVASVLSGNRNFEGRVNPLVRANYLASPPLVVAYALAGDMDMDLTREPLGRDPQGSPVFLRDIWPTEEEIRDAGAAIDAGMFSRRYQDVFSGDASWQAIQAPSGSTYAWSDASTYIKRPPFFDHMPRHPAPLSDIEGGRVLAMLGDSVTTDHISPAGSIPRDSAAGRWLMEQGVKPADFNSYGARRGNHEVMMRGTFGSIRLRNQLAPGTEGAWTEHIPSGETMTLFDAAMRYRADGVPLVVLAGKEYGTGSSRDWAAKGPALLGVRAVIAETFERIHRSNLAGMGVLPLQYEPGQSAASLGLTGRERFAIRGIAAGLRPGAAVAVIASPEEGAPVRFQAVARLDTPQEVEYQRHGGILPYVLRSLLA
ncbi:MAG TPA: aconitate hydratase AcnA [Candidatus Polarisedimenticolia bacterium]|nr:aconitate hydratase AcnA [Candidatus Polarisedimenticolia bacterium]